MAAAKKAKSFRGSVFWKKRVHFIAPAKCKTLNDFTLKGASLRNISKVFDPRGPQARDIGYEKHTMNIVE